MIRMVPRRHIVIAVMFVCIAEYSENSTTKTTANVGQTSEEPLSTRNPQSYNESSTASTTSDINVTEINMPNSTSNVDLTTFKTTSPCSPPCYLGCFKSKNYLQKIKIKEKPDRQVVDCMAKCTASRYVGIQIQKQSDNSILCQCLGNDMDNFKRKPDDKCNRTCSGAERLQCGSQSKWISVYQIVNQSPSNVQYEKPSTGVELYILITVVSLIGFTCLCVLSIFGIRKFKRHQESNEYEDDHYYSYCHVPCNEIATSCSIEGSSNVTYLKNYPAKLPPPRKINRQSFANETSISEQVIPESDELEVTDIKNGEEEVFQNNDESHSVLEAHKTVDEQYDNNHYYVLESNTSDKVITSNEYEQHSGDLQHT